MLTRAGLLALHRSHRQVPSLPCKSRSSFLSTVSLCADDQHDLAGSLLIKQIGWRATALRLRTGRKKVCDDYAYAQLAVFA